LLSGMIRRSPLIHGGPMHNPFQPFTDPFDMYRGLVQQSESIPIDYRSRTYASHSTPAGCRRKPDHAKKPAGIPLNGPAGGDSPPHARRFDKVIEVQSSSVPPTPGRLSCSIAVDSVARPACSFT
jgi:hypothetical protein